MSRWVAALGRHSQVLLVTCVLLAYLPSLSGGFLVYDDDWLIENNALLSLPPGEALSRMLLDFGLETRLALGAEYLPVRDLSYYVDATWLSRDPQAMRVVQLVVYVVAVLLVRAALLRSLDKRIHAEIGAWCFALHPVHVESVAWLSGRKDVLALAFLGGALLCYELGRRARWAAVALVVVACFCKSMSLVAPGLLLAQAGIARRRPRWPVLMATGAASAVAFVVHRAVGARVAMVGGPLDGDLWAAVWTMGEVWLRYLRLLVDPTSLSIAHEVPVASAMHPASVVGWLALLLSLVVGLHLTWRRGRPRVLGVWLWFMLPLAPVSQILIPLQNVMADRYLWLSVLGLGLVLGSAARLGRSGLALACAALLVMAGSTALRATLFGDGSALFADAARKTRGPLAPLQEGFSLERDGDLRGAERAYREACERPCESRCEMARRATNNLARLLAARGALEEADTLLRTGMQRFPRDPKVHFNRVRVLHRLGLDAEARALYERSVERFPNYAKRSSSTRSAGYGRWAQVAPDPSSP